MKKGLTIKSILCLLLVAMTIIGCGNGNEEEQNDSVLQVRNVFNTGCKERSMAKGTNSFAQEKETLVIKGTGKGWIRVDHKNTLFNCCSDKITVDISQESNTITANEEDDDHSCNCVCPFDVEYEIGPVEKSGYTLIIKKNGLQVLKEAFTYSDDLKKEITID